MLLPRPLSNDHWFIQFILRNSNASTSFVEVYQLEHTKVSSTAFFWKNLEKGQHL